VQDQLQFSGNPGSDFHECELVDIPAFTVSVQKSLSNGKVEAIPNPANAGATQWIRDFMELYPEESEAGFIVMGTPQNKATDFAVTSDLPFHITAAFEFNPEDTHPLLIIKLDPGRDRTPAYVVALTTSLTKANAGHTDLIKLDPALAPGERRPGLTVGRDAVDQPPAESPADPDAPDSDTNDTARTSVRLRLRPGPFKAVNVAYRYARDSLEQTDFSFAWPLGEKWDFIGRYNYSLQDQKPLDRFVGIEYSGCCWGISLLGRRTVIRSTGESDSSISFQFILKGFSNLGSKTSRDLKRDILSGMRYQQ